MFKSTMQQVSSAAFTDTKPHYELLDGLRGIAALLVLWYHVQEGFAFAGGKSTMQQVSSAAFTDTKPHYELLDGLRGIAALLVLWYHVQEGFAFAGGAPVIEHIFAGGAPVIEHMNHGYLAVDFFFILSGFVIGYAYDDRWNKCLTKGNFFKRRLIRLHPMVVL